MTLTLKSTVSPTGTEVLAAATALFSLTAAPGGRPGPVSSQLPLFGTRVVTIL